MRQPEQHELNLGPLRAEDVRWQVELPGGQNKKRYKTNSSLPGTQIECTMQVKSIETTKKLPPSAFHNNLHPRNRYSSIAISRFLTLSLASVLIYVAFASRFTTISGAETSAQHHNHDRHQQNHLRGHESNHHYLNEIPRHFDVDNSMHGSGRYELKHQRPLRIKHLQEQRRLRNLIARTSSTSKLLGVKKAIANVHDKSPSHQQQQSPSSAVQNLHNRRRYHFYDNNEIQHPKAISKHFNNGAPRLGARSKTTTPGQNAHGFSMHDESKFWDDLGQDQDFGDEFEDVDSLDVDLYEDDDEDAEEEDDDDDDEVVENLDEDVDEQTVPSENLINSHAKHLWKGFSIPSGAHHSGEHHSKTRYHAEHPNHRNQDSSPMIARSHHNAIQHDDSNDLPESRARNKKFWLHYERHHVHEQPAQPAGQHQQRVSQVPYQSPVVVSISDNSFVSASPPVILGPDTSREEQQRIEHKGSNAIDAMAASDEPDGDRPTTVNSATTSIGDDDDASLERDHILANNISGSVTGSLLNITAYNRVETSTRGNTFISDHDDGVSRHRKVHLLRPPASGDTFNNFMDNSIRYSKIAPPLLRPTAHADQISHHSRKDKTGSHLAINGRHVPPRLATNGHTTYMYDLELTATTTPRSTMPPPTGVASYKTDGAKATNDDNDDGDDDDETSTDDDGDDIDPDEDDENSLTIDSFQAVHPKSKESNAPARYSHIIASPNNELPSYGRKYWHTPHRASIQLVQEESNGFHRASINSAIIAILFGIGAMGMLIMIVNIKMGSIRERVAYKGRRRSLVPDTDFLINTIPI